MQQRSFLRWHTIFVGGARGWELALSFEMRWGALGKGVEILFSLAGKSETIVVLEWKRIWGRGEVNMEHLGGIPWMVSQF